MLLRYSGKYNDIFQSSYPGSVPDDLPHHNNTSQHLSDGTEPYIFFRFHRHNTSDRPAQFHGSLLNELLHHNSNNFLPSLSSLSLTAFHLSGNSTSNHSAFSLYLSGRIPAGHNNTVRPPQHTILYKLHRFL